MEAVFQIIEPEITQSWEKFAHSAKKAGFRDGAADAQQNNFQECFDKGYIEGFKNGFLLGKYKGIARSRPETNKYLENTRRGCCQICDNEMILNSTINEIIQEQLKFTNSLLDQLNSK